MRLLLIEDDRKFARFVRTGLQEAGYIDDHAADGEDGLHFFVTETYDAAIVDLMLPGIDGLSLIRDIRSQGITTPILILSARRKVNERVEGLAIGADDYLTKPFAFTELLARIQAIVRCSTMAAPQAELSVADLTLWYSLIFTLCAVVQLLIFYTRVAFITSERVDQELEEEVEEFAAVMRASGLNAVIEEIRIEGGSEAPGSVFMRLLSSQGDVLIQTNATPWGGEIPLNHDNIFTADPKFRFLL